MTPVTLSGLAAWLPFLATLQQQQKPYRAPARQAQLNRRVKRDGAAAAVDVTNLGSSIPSVARQMGLDVSDEEVREIGGFLQPLLNSIGLGGLAAEHEGGQARASDPRRRARAGATGAEQRRDAGQRLRTGAASRENAAGEGLWSNFAGFDLGLPDDDDDYFIPVKGDVDDDDGDDGYGGDDVASWRTRSRKTATDRARRRREDEARRARRRREATQTRSRAGLGRRGGAADVEHTRQELAGALRELVRDLFG
ncbi:hypothetical protein K437DRAFT_154965 [Tilletiaria anomala UBC 951]|uniref:Uncharacterized protein n=1 Tax=Tilletiaria anomala (strain ATCC 24038 / CBS 436.72 / UBC 951) TaxID=1037660 RepID=A0A066VWB5_TILAU|nr:uncharacterized protein K437DRAFT_154965 [Tilletiaria anomala UBC 951]KDN43104.1 hypothetical protein K437DRAFT_154965 [Tilletiaria anomala UBC 951]